MLINNNTQAATTIQQLKRADMDPANAAASSLYSGALQAAQQTVVVPAAQKDLDQTNDRIDEAFAKTRVQLQASTTGANPSTDAPNASAPAGSASADFSDYIHKSPGERIREELLKEKGLTEADVQKMPPEQQDALAKEVTQRMKDEHDQKVAARSADTPQTQTVQDTLAAV